MPRRAPLLPPRPRRPFVREERRSVPPPPALPIPLVSRKSEPEEVVFDLTRRRETVSEP